MSGIGGFLDIELRGQHSWHPGAMEINSCRNALRFLIRNKDINEVYISYYTCSVVYDALKKEGVSVKFYHLGEDLLPTDIPLSLRADSVLIYTNYWGICDKQVEQMIHCYGRQLIIDAAQAFYYKPPQGIATINSARKFFGVPDGGYLYSDLTIAPDVEDTSYERFEHLLKRFELSSNEAYPAYLKAEECIDELEVKKMSKLTKALLATTVDYAKVREIRRANFEYVHKSLKASNRLSFEMLYTSDSVPLAYPYYCSKAGLKKDLINNKIYVPTYWPNVFEWCTEESLEYQLAQNIIPIPIDQRYNLENMKFIVENIINNK